ncbi:MAG: sulfite exporter TauE/SafE family protein, partial [Anaerolineae bacterium]|nr:sulfite exporter TauE/SafE family protein [Anaerolineae bacterium]
GLPPALASASVHLSEVFTTAVSGTSHWRLGNIDKKLVTKLLLPGMIGGAVGAYLLTSIPGDVIRPYLSLYLALMGIYIIWKALRRKTSNTRTDTPKYTSVLGVVGGFFDAIGGGGWGPIVTTTLLARGNNPQKTVGSVNLSEFAVTLTQSIVFLLTLKVIAWNVVAGLIVGGVLAAPLGALMVRRVPAKALMGIIGVLIITLSLRTMILAWL